MDLEISRGERTHSCAPQTNARTRPMLFFHGVRIPAPLSLHVPGEIPLAVGSGGLLDVPLLMERARRAVAGGSSLIVARGGEGFVPVRTHLGCLVAVEEPVMRSGNDDDVPLLEDFLALSRAGGRLPIIRGIRPNRAALYRSRGLVVRRSGEVLAVKLGAATPESVARTPMGRNAGALSRVGAALTVVPAPVTVAVLEQLRGLDPALEPERMGELNPAIVRIHGHMVAWALVRAHDDGTVLTMERARVSPGAPATAMDFLLVRLVEHARGRGYRRLILGDEHGPGLPPSASPAEKSLPVTQEPRYTARPGGLRGLWAALSDRILTWSGG